MKKSSHHQSITRIDHRVTSRSSRNAITRNSHPETNRRMRLESLPLCARRNKRVKLSPNSRNQTSNNLRSKSSSHLSNNQPSRCRGRR